MIIKGIYMKDLFVLLVMKWIASLSLSIKINELYIICPRGGGYVKIGRNYTGHILCPDYNLICSQKVRCNNMFDCVEKESRMKKDYKYDYTLVNVSVQIILPDKNEDYEKGYELSDDGVCPKDWVETMLWMQISLLFKC